MLLCFGLGGSQTHLAIGSSNPLFSKRRGLPSSGKANIGDLIRSSMSARLVHNSTDGSFCIASPKRTTLPATDRLHKLVPPTSAKAMLRNTLTSSRFQRTV
eukprot:3970756-Amphidinium_carterae.1